MNILFVNDFKEKVGGAETYIYTLVDELDKRDYTTNIFTGDLIYKNFKYKKSIVDFVNLFFNIKYFIKFRNEIKKINPDIIHLNNIFYELSPSLLLTIGKTPILMTVHDNQIVNPVSMLSGRTGKECKKRTCGGCTNCVGLKGAIYEWIKRKIHRQLLKRVNLYITPSEYMKSLMEEAGFSPVKCIPNGFQLYNASPLINNFKLLYIGRLSKEKGVEYLIQAMPQILQKHPKTVLYIVGDGHETDNLKLLTTNLKIQNNVIFKPNIPHEQIEDYYKQASVVIVPSIYHDNLPTVCIEAMSVGRPLIGTKMGGIPELITDRVTGLLIEPKNSDQIAQAAIQLLSDENLLKQMSRNSSEKSKNYSINIHLDKIEKMYENVSLGKAL